jgi:hypothetical protein
MNRITKPLAGTVATVILTAVAVPTLFAPSQALAGPPADSRVYPINSRPHGASYAEWSAGHWRWLYSLPVDHHPLFDTADCSAGQSGRVWFLGGTFTLSTVNGTVVGKVTRECTIPTGTSLFFPLLDAECSEIEGNGTTEAELRACAKMNADLIIPGSLFCLIDGMPVSHPERYRVQSPLFTFGPLPANNVLQFSGVPAPPGATSPAVSDGYFLMLKPFPPGKHTIHFGGTADLTSIGGPVFIQDITYHLTVKDGEGDEDD